MRYVLQQIFSGVPRWVYRLVFFMVTFISLHLMYGDVIYRLFWNGFFATNSIYQHEVVDHTGGALRYLAQFLHQLLYYPTLGALLVAALATGVAYLLDKCCALTQLLSPITFFPSVILIALYTGVGYDIYMRIDTSFGLSTLLGILFALTLFYLYQISERLRWGEPLMLLTTALLYPALGFYALVALLMMTLRTWYTKRYFPVAVGVSLFSLFALPFIFDVWCFNDEFNWGASSLLLTSSYMKLRMLQIVAACSLLIFANPLHKMCAQWPSYCQMILFALLFVLLYALSYKDKIYYSELKVSRLTDECKWKEVLEECKKHKKISHTLNAYRVIALAYTDQLPDQLFKIDFSFEKTPFTPTEYLLYEDEMTFHAGFVNSATRVSIESWQRFGLSYRRIRLLALCALLRHENQLAERYMNQMSQSFVMAEELADLGLLKNDREVYMNKHPECRMVEKRMPNENVLFLGDATVSRYFLCFSDLPRESFELRLMSDLWERNMSAFLNDVGIYAARTDKPIATCVKEAAAIAVLNGTDRSLLSVVKMDDATLQRVGGFFRTLQSYGRERMDQARKEMKSTYGKSYCYYFTFRKEEN